MEGTVGLGDAMLMCQNGNGYNNNAMWNNPFMYLMWASMFGGFNGWGGNRFGGADYVSQAQLAQGLDNQDKNSQLRGLANGLADLGYAITNNIKDTGAGVAKAVNDVGAGVAMGFCQTNHNIDNLKYENAKNTEYIVNNGHADTQRIIDRLCTMEMNAKDAKIAELAGHLADAKLNLSQAAQSAYIIDKLTPAT